MDKTLQSCHRFSPQSQHLNLICSSHTRLHCWSAHFAKEDFHKNQVWSVTFKEFMGMERQAPVLQQRRPHSNAQIVANATIPNLAWLYIQKLNIRILSTNVRFVTNHSLEPQMLPDTLMRFITIWQSCIHASGVAKSSGKIKCEFTNCLSMITPILNYLSLDIFKRELRW